ncbi:MAG TPA: class I SAM-dependent methyltransferase [Chloroflexota bacterium]
MKTAIPPLVSRAMQLAADRGFEQSCTVEVGRLLHLLTSHQDAGVVGEMGTGCGVGAAWMATALRPYVSLVTVELDPGRSEAATELLADVPYAQVIQGDWRALLPHGPFRLLFVDASEPKRERPAEVVDALELGGIAVLDDFTPTDRWPEESHGRPDPVREFWRHDSRLTATEILVSPDMAIILATRKR